MNRALNLFETMTQKESQTWHDDIQYINRWFCKVGDMEKAKELWVDMCSRGISFNHI